MDNTLLILLKSIDVSVSGLNQNVKAPSVFEFNEDSSGLETVNYGGLPEYYLINLSNPDLEDWYAKAQVGISGKQPGDILTLEGSPMVYGITQLKNAPNAETADAFLDFFFDSTKGMKIIEDQGQTVVVPAPTSSYEKLSEKFKKYALSPSGEKD